MQSLSSTSSSEPTPIRPLRELSIIVLFFVMAEVVVRILVGADVLGPPHGQWPRSDYPSTIAMIERQQPEVIVTGNSRVVSGFNPTIFSQFVTNETGQPIRTLNAGHGGTSPQILAPLIRYFYMPKAPSAKIIVAISPLDMGSSNIAWQQEATNFLDSPEVREQMGQSEFDPRAAFDDLWYTYAYRHALGEFIQNLRPPRLSLPNRDEQGYLFDDTIMDVQATRENFVIEDLAVNENFPQTTDGPSLDALIDLMQHSDGRLIVVNVPSYISILPGYEDYEPIYRDLWPQIEAQCAQYSIPCWDFQTLVEDGTLDASHFSNPTHLNADGAVIFSIELARRYTEPF